ncbi:uncharacterized protein FFM5_15364 [Fusarium fujikuroi]|nr:uncharacterized protein FFM5_15364 [Fusarium fujikuroi]
MQVYLKSGFSCITISR